MAIYISVNHIFHERTKHVEMDCYFVRERIIRGDAKAVKINTEKQVDDILTKPLGTERFKYLSIS